MLTDNLEEIIMKVLNIKRYIFQFFGLNKERTWICYFYRCPYEESNFGRRRLSRFLGKVVFVASIHRGHQTLNLLSWVVVDVFLVSITWVSDLV